MEVYKIIYIAVIVILYGRIKYLEKACDMSWVHIQRLMQKLNSEDPNAY